MKRRIIKKIAVLGSGVMGSRIACHFANIGVEVLLLDILPKSLNEKEKKQKFSFENPIVRNRIANESLALTLKSKPRPLYDRKFSSRISTGNFEDDLSKVADADWILEAVVENLSTKQSLFRRVSTYRKKGTIISSNTSGIPIHSIVKDQDEDLRKNFCGTHFFNPPRYLRLLEIIPTSETDPFVIDFLMHYGNLFLGKKLSYVKIHPPLSPTV